MNNNIMCLGLHARITVEPQAIMSSRWVHDMANVFCRIKLRLEVDALTALAG